MWKELNDYSKGAAMETLRIGIVGVGYIGNKHIETIRRIPHTRIMGVVDADYERACRTARDLEIPCVYTTVDEMLASDQIDVIHNCTPTSKHFEVNKKVICAGKSLYCEKPLTMNLEEAAELMALLEKNPVPNAVNLNYRMNALVQEMRTRVQDGESGRLFMVTGSYVQDWMMYQDDYDWRLDLEMGGRSRALSDIGSHLFDLCQFVTGQHITAVNAKLMIVHPKRLHYEKDGGTFSKEKGRFLGEVEVQNEDVANIMIRLSGGAEGMMQVSQITAGHKNDLRLRLDLEKCSYEWKQENGDMLYIGYRGRPNEILHREADMLSEQVRGFSRLPAGHPEGWNDVLYNAISAFYRSINEKNDGQTVPYATIEDGVSVMKVIDACMKSDREMRWVDVEMGACL